MQLTRAFELLYTEYAGTVFSTALSVLGERTQAEDVAQDVFMRLWREPGRFDADRGTLGAYVRMLARHRAVDVWRESQVAGRARDRMRRQATCEEMRREERPALAAELRRDSRVVVAALGRLPESQRQSLVLAYWGGLTAEEIAAVTRAPVGTVKSRIRLGLMNMRRRTERQLEPALPVAA
jgi:RNA polymerase sigma-70 factor (ECF subfamily)